MTEGARSEADASPGGGKRVLVVDDVRLFRELVQLILSGGGYEVITAPTGAEAIDLARVCPPDLVLLDLYMPGMDGEATCRAIRADPRLADVPVVMLTSRGDPGEVARCVDAGCDDYVLKPVRRGPLLRKIVALVDERAFERVRVPLGVPVRYGLVPGSHSLAGRAVNISAGGIFVETDEPEGWGRDLALSFALPGSEAAIAASGRVAWVNNPAERRKRDCGGGMGIAFRDLPEGGRTLIARFVRRQRRTTLGT